MTALLSICGFGIACWLVGRSFWAGLYTLFIYSFLQNFLVPLFFTAGWISSATAIALILFKEILLLILAAFSMRAVIKAKVRMPLAARLLISFTMYCAARGVISLAAGDTSADCVRILRQVCYPIQIFAVGMAASLMDSRRATKFLRHNIVLLFALAAVALALFFAAGTDFWAKYVNIATYNVDVKGEEASDQVLDEGVSATGGGREEFSFLGNFRAMGTFGDPIALSFELALPTLLLLFWQKRPKKASFALLIFVATLFATLTRSAWIFTAVALLFVLIVRRRYVLLLSVLLVGGTALIVLSPLTEFVSTSVDKLVNQDPTDYHSQGITGFYIEALPDPSNLLGKGLDPAVQTVPESGYAYLLQHFGLPALLLFVGCHCALFHDLRAHVSSDATRRIIAQGLVLGTLVTMHFSQYPLSFLAYLTIWFYLGHLLPSPAVEVANEGLARLELGWGESAR